VPGSARKPRRNLTAEVGPPYSANPFFHGLGHILPNVAWPDTGGKAPTQGADSRRSRDGDLIAGNDPWPTRARTTLCRFGDDQTVGVGDSGSLCATVMRNTIQLLDEANKLLQFLTSSKIRTRR
jgi:hypothetical protein